MVQVVLSENDSLEWALKKLRRKMIRAGLFREMRRRRYYEKPSETRRRKIKAAKRRRRRGTARV
ncbi:MAG: 30S ribosomal protein S21 [Gemmatimonas sp. SM23_52]|nr:MAG: 30S ribosomal protein S21 [Gemmatimonas sp. SM23_52]